MNYRNSETYAKLTGADFFMKLKIISFDYEALFAINKNKHRFLDNFKSDKKKTNLKITIVGLEDV